MELKNSEKLDTAIEESMHMCRGVAQRYLAYIQGVPVDHMYVVQPTQKIGFVAQGKTHYLQLCIVDDPYYIFDISRCNNTAVVATIEKIMKSLRLVTAYILEHETPVVARPELFQDSRICWTPSTTAFLYNETHGRELHDIFHKRIAFAWV